MGKFWRLVWNGSHRHNYFHTYCSLLLLWNLLFLCQKIPQLELKKAMETDNLNPKALSFYRSKIILDSSKLFLDQPKSFEQHLKNESYFWFHPKQYDYGWVQNSFGPIEG